MTPGPAGSATLSTHVLDATSGRPAAGVPVRLERRGPDGWSPAGSGQTDADGRLRLAGGADSREPSQAGQAGQEFAAGSGPGFEPGVYRITFDTGVYFQARGVASFYPEVTVTFELAGPGEHYHVPLLLSPFAYSTYRGS